MIITVGSITYATKLKKLLYREGIKSTLVKSEVDGNCVHGVKIENKDFYSAVVLLKENNIAYSVKEQ